MTTFARVGSRAPFALAGCDCSVPADDMALRPCVIFMAAWTPRRVRDGGERGCTPCGTTVGMALAVRGATSACPVLGRVAVGGVIKAARLAADSARLTSARRTGRGPYFGQAITDSENSWRAGHSASTARASGRMAEASRGAGPRGVNRGCKLSGGVSGGWALSA